MSEDRASRSRRDFLKIGAAAGLGAAVAGLGLKAGEPSPAPGQARTQFRAPALPTVKVGFVGVGGMGSAHVQNYLQIDGVEIKAICDIRPAHVERAQKWVVDAGQPQPRGYSNGERDFERMCETEDLDLVMTATPWEWHVPVCLAAMRNGKHAATEVPAAMSIEHCWALVEAAEKYGKHCQMMENCCYDRIELMTLNLVRRGLLGEILHAEAGYLHDLRGVKFSDEGEGLWRRAWAQKLNGNLYPTHGLGPVAQCLNVNRGDAFDYLVSMSSPARGLHEYAVASFGADSPQAGERYVLGDVNTSLIKTKLGKTIILIHDTNLPRPYTRINLVQGTRGLAHKWPDRIYVEGRAAKPHEWDDFEKFAAEYEHPLWRAIAAKGEGRGHGGMDYIEDYRLVQSLRRGEPLDQDVYDAAAWSAIVGASARSVALKGRPVDIPDFTRGRWKTTPPLGIVEA
ncbi:MAG TPA: Gfo/Idh/MocA family oxidoreductase [Candidatus Aminicenantes bacterium]|nr:Gfo/Idh/MocA family oxidoreductase [Candidatus Aminicenantes bacterium]HRY65452.1 Gfo/Idh/MocA family oxidoreductase [Candidatus Aminicenantes bacterium]HRZ72080.1 Gfo/Idh/MocA family oxidoreductase [Candidatus Aminicenantes bacterium]